MEPISYDHIAMRDLAFKIADSCAASDIETNCPWVGDDDQGIAGEVPRGAGQWYDTAAAVEGLELPENTEWLRDAVRYLEWRGMLIRNPGAPHLVRVRDTPSGNCSK
jgi:hypothetical protein